MDIHPIYDYDYVNKQVVPLATNKLRWFHFQNVLNTKVLLNYYFDGYCYICYICVFDDNGIIQKQNRWECFP